MLAGVTLCRKDHQGLLFVHSHHILAFSDQDVLVVQVVQVAPAFSVLGDRTYQVQPFSGSSSVVVATVVAASCRQGSLAVLRDTQADRLPAPSSGTQAVLQGWEDSQEVLRVLLDHQARWHHIRGDTAQEEHLPVCNCIRCIRASSAAQGAACDQDAAAAVEGNHQVVVAAAVVVAVGHHYLLLLSCPCFAHHLDHRFGLRWTRSSRGLRDRPGQLDHHRTDR